MTLVSVTAYHSFSGEVEALNTPTIRRLTPSRRHQLPRITQKPRACPESRTKREAVDRILQIDPTFRVPNLRDLFPIRRDGHVGAFEEGLR